MIARALTWSALVSAAWTIGVWATGGLNFRVPGLDLRSTDPLRPLALALVLFLVRLLAFRQRHIWNDVYQPVRRLTAPRLRWVLVVCVFALGVLRGSATASGADQYGYVSQADLWLRGDLATPQPIAAAVPWPDAQWTFAPLGYRPTQTGDGIVPTYSPGLPLLLALFKLVGGQCAMALVLPLAGALLVTATFSVGRIAVSEQVGAAAAWLVATSPVVLYMMMSPMSDLPAAACWALAAYGCLTGSRRGAFFAGCAAALAILIRPNLAHLAVVMGLWLLIRDWSISPLASRIRRAVLFSAPVGLGCVAIAMLNQSLYGSAATSGYGSLETLFTTAHVRENVVNYAMWLTESSTPVALAGLVALWIPARVVPGGRLQMNGRALLSAMSLAVAVSYVLYLPFDAWWFLRFLLPLWPALAVSTARLCAVPAGDRFSKPAIVLLAIVGTYGVWYTYDHIGFELGTGDQRYIKVARLVSAATEPDSIIISVQHSGTLRYYGGRATLRYDYVQPRWLDRTIAWLSDRGIHPYILLDDWEHDGFRTRFAARSAFGRLDSLKVLEYRSSTSTILYDPLKPAEHEFPHLVVTSDAATDRTRACAPGVPFTMPSMSNTQR